MGERHIDEDASFEDQNFIIEMMELSEDIMESDDINKVKGLKEEILESKEGFFKEASDSFKTKNYESAFMNLAKMNILKKKLELAEFQLDNLSED